MRQWMVAFLVVAQVLGITEILRNNRYTRELNIKKCQNETSCYTAFPYVTQSILTYQKYPVLKYSYNTLDICALNLTSMYNVTCMDFFCSDRNTLKQTIDRFNGKSTIATSDATLTLSYFHGNCYFCNHTDRAIFRQLLANGSCPFFWKHDPNYCYDTPRDVGENMVNKAGYHILGDRYLNYRRSIDPSLKLDLGKLDDLLNLTLIRAATDDHLTERQREEFPYLCYCPSDKRFGSQCDVNTHILLPFFNEVQPYMAFALKIVFGIFFLLIIVIPKHVGYVIDFKSQGFSTPKIIMQACFMQLDALASVAAFVSIIFQAINDIIIPILNAAAAVFNVLSYVLLGVCIVLLLVQWLHIYSCSSELMMKGRLSLKHRIILGVMLGMLAILVIIGVAGQIAAASIAGRVPNATYNAYNDNFNMVLYLAAVVLLGGYSIGFLVYGLLMYRILKSMSNDVSIFQLRFTRVMIMVDLSFLHFMCWLVVLAVDFPLFASYGPFMSLYTNTFTFLSMFLTFTAVGYMLFNVKDFKRTYTCKN